MVHVITHKRLLDFGKAQPEARGALDAWYRRMKRMTFDNFAALKCSFPTVDKVGSFFVFNIGGNKYRLVAAIHFNRNKVYIRHVMTHADYDRHVWR